MDGNDRLIGWQGSDHIRGGAGNDRLVGGLGDDRLAGGLGRDVLSGRDGADVFDFNAVAGTGAGASRDRIFGFTHLADAIDLSTIDALAGGVDDAFVFRGVGAFTGAGQVRLEQVGDDTLVKINTVGASEAEASILLTDITASTLTAADFVL